MEQQISRALRSEYPHDHRMQLATESIYTAIYRPAAGLLTPREPSPLRTGRDHRRGHSRPVRAGRRFAQPMLSIHDRGFDPTDRSVPGHWEGYLIVGPQHRSAIGTLVERQTRYVQLLHLTDGTSAELHAVLVRVPGQLPRPLRQMLTWDQGNEMAKHRDLTTDTGIKVYFCDASSPWQRGTNENTNGMLRQYFPKSTDLSVYTPRDLAQVQDELNQRPRLVLADQTPAQRFTELLASQRPLLR